MKHTIKIEFGTEWLNHDDSTLECSEIKPVTVAELGELLDEHPESVDEFGTCAYRTKPDYTLERDGAYWATGRHYIRLADGQYLRAKRIWNAACKRWSFSVK